MSWNVQFWYEGTIVAQALDSEYLGVGRVGPRRFEVQENAEQNNQVAAKSEGGLAPRGGCAPAGASARSRQTRNEC